MNLNIKGKLIGGFSIILVLLIFMAYFSTNKLSESNQRMLNIVDLSSRKVILTNELMIAMLNEARYEKDIILEKDPVKKEYFRDQIYRELDIIDKKATLLEGMVDGKGIEYLKVFTTAWSTYKPELQKIVFLAMKNKESEAFDISSETGMKVRDSAISDLNKLIVKNESGMSEAKVQNESNYTTAIDMIVALIIASILF